MNPIVSGLKALAKKGAKEAAQKPFYSAVDKAIVDIVGKQPKGTGDQYLGMILKAKGVKPAEVKDRGLDTALKGRGRMSGEDLVKTAEDRPAPQITSETATEYLDEYGNPISGSVHYGEEDYGQYRTPFGENYREVKIYLPQQKASVKPITAEDLKAQGYTVGDLQFNPVTFQSSYKLYDKDGNFVSQRSGAYGVSTPEQAFIDEARMMTERETKEAGKPLYRAPHFGREGENLLAHARVQDMTGPNGEKILLIDEIQSDWHQAGRKKGYRTKESEERYRNIEREYDEYIKTLKPRVREVLEKSKIPEESIEQFLKAAPYSMANLIGEAEKFSKYQNDLFKFSPEKLPADAPFKKNWQELVVKRLMDDAAKKGYDRVLITPGAVQARRYDLSQHVDKLVYHDESQHLMAIKNGEVKFTEKIEPSKLADYVGAETAQKLLSQEPVQSRRIGETTERILSGIDLEVGGEGMKGFYDTILPSYIKKQYGVEMGQYPVHAMDYDVIHENRGGFTVVPRGGSRSVGSVYQTREEAQAAADKMSEVPYHSFDITPEMRESITTQGQPLYQLAPVGGAIGAGMIATDEEPAQYKRGGAVKKAEGGAATINEAMLRRERRLGKVNKPVSISPKQIARGWAAGTLGLPGDIESLGRAVIPGVSEETFLPTSEDMLKKIPGAAADEVGQRAAQVGTLFGGVGAARIANAMRYLPTDVMRAAVEAYGPQATAAHVIKPKGGNWLSGEVEGRLKSLKTGSPDQVTVINDPNASGGVRYEKLPEDPLNQWIDKQLTRYVKNEMGTPEDPIRKIAETGNIHMPTYEIFDPSQSMLMAKRLSVRMPAKGMGQSQTAKNWEDIVDRAIEPSSAGSYVYGALDEDILKKNPWLSKVDPEAMVYYAKGLPRDVGFDHLIDELSNALDPNSGLPRNLQLKPESLSRLSVPQAVERVAKINEWRAAQKAEADLARANNPATVTVKEYPEGFRWAELKMPEGAEDNKALADALKYEGEQMGHCVGGYCPDVESGQSKIYSLRDAKGQSHVTVEVSPKSFDEMWSNLSKDEQALIHGKASSWASDEELKDIGKKLFPDKFKDANNIVQIKGKGNAKPADKYLPFVQDFVRSGNWSDIGDFRNTGLYKKSDFIDEFTPEQLDSAGKGEYLTMEEIRNLREGKQWKPIDTDPDLDINIDNLGMKRGGPVSMDAMRLAVMDKNLRKKHG